MFEEITKGPDLLDCGHIYLIRGRLLQCRLLWSPPSDRRLNPFDLALPHLLVNFALNVQAIYVHA